MILNPFKKNRIAEFLPKIRGKYTYDVPMKKYTRLAVGGNAEVLFEPEDAKDLEFFIRTKPRNLPIFVLGGGSNVLVRDGGIIGVVLKLSSPSFKKHELNGNLLTCGAGLNNANLLRIMCDSLLGGLEFLCTIPGTIGGAMRTNASCFGFSISDYWESAQIMDRNGDIKELYREDFNTEYRDGMFPDDWIILNVTFRMENSAKHIIKGKIKEYQAYKKANQPCDKRTAGSFFKNPDGLMAWELVKKAGCDRLKHGGAEVSAMHNNFIINKGGATASDIEILGDEIIQKVKEKTSIVLEPRIKKVGVKK